MDKKNKKIPLTPTIPQKAQKKKTSTLSLLIGCMKFLFPKQLVTFSSKTNYRFGVDIVKVDSFETIIRLQIQPSIANL
jgi:hypothetical protein